MRELSFACLVLFTELQLLLTATCAGVPRDTRQTWPDQIVHSIEKKLMIALPPKWHKNEANYDTYQLGKRRGEHREVGRGKCKPNEEEK